MTGRYFSVRLLRTVPDVSANPLFRCSKMVDRKIKAGGMISVFVNALVVPLRCIFVYYFMHVDLFMD